MTERSEELISLKSRLSVEELSILNIELERRRKSVGVTYFLWFFLSWLGIHKFYLAKVITGVLYLVGPWAAVVLLGFGVLMAESSVEAGAVTVLAGILALLAYSIWWFVDLFTIPRQVTRYNEDIELEIIDSLTRKRETHGLRQNPTTPE